MQNLNTETYIEDKLTEENDLEFEENLNNKYLSFKLGKESYGIPISKVSEIVEIQKISEVPDMPFYVKGVINLRGKIIPVMDLRLRFKMDSREYDDRTCIIITKINGIDTGIIVDTVEEVVEIIEENIDRNSISSPGGKGNISGIGRRGEKVLIIINTENLTRCEDMGKFYHVDNEPDDEGK